MYERSVHITLTSTTAPLIHLTNLTGVLVIPKNVYIIRSKMSQCIHTVSWTLAHQPSQ